MNFKWWVRVRVSPPASCSHTPRHQIWSVYPVYRSQSEETEGPAVVKHQIMSHDDSRQKLWRILSCSVNVPLSGLITLLHPTLPWLQSCPGSDVTCQLSDWFYIWTGLNPESTGSHVHWFMLMNKLTFTYEQNHIWYYFHSTHLSLLLLYRQSVSLAQRLFRFPGFIFSFCSFMCSISAAEREQRFRCVSSCFVLLCVSLWEGISRRLTEHYWTGSADDVLQDFVTSMCCFLLLLVFSVLVE